MFPFLITGIAIFFVIAVVISFTLGILLSPVFLGGICAY